MYSKKYKFLIVVSIVLGVFAIGGLTYYLVKKELNHYENGVNIKDENALVIGTYIKSKDQFDRESNNTIHIKVVDKGNIVKRIDYVTTSNKTSDDYVIKQDTRYENMIFLDIKELMKNYTNDLGIRFWYQSNPSKNYVSVAIENNSKFTYSAEYKVTDCGIYCLNVPNETDDVVQVEHAYIYQRNVFGWSFK